MFDQFLQERVYLKGISSETQRYYRLVKIAFASTIHNPTKAGALECIVRLRERGVKPISINSYLCGFNAYCMWLHKEHGKELVKIPRLKEEQKILQTLPAGDIRAILSYKPVGVNLRRAHTIALLILDTGLRASECTSLTKQNTDFDNLVLRIRGKGNKERLIPFSQELRKLLWRYAAKKDTLLFGTKNNTPISVRNLERDFNKLGSKLDIKGVRFSPHTLRHTFACCYLKNGGNLFYLSKILGHSNITTTQIYLKSIGIEDLSNVHGTLSPLSQVHRPVR